MTEPTETTDTISHVVTMLAERMANHPEDFMDADWGGHSPQVKGAPKFYRVQQALSQIVRPNREEIEDDVLGSTKRGRLWFLNDDEIAVLREAYTMMNRNYFEAFVVNAIMNKEEPAKEDYRIRPKGTTTANMLNALNTGTSLTNAFHTMKEIEAMKMQADYLRAQNAQFGNPYQNAADQSTAGLLNTLGLK